jgi:ComF family protein
MDWRLEEAAIETFYALGEYLGPLRKALVKLKYGNGRYLAPALAAGLAGRLADGDFAEAVLVPVPLHVKRQRERGYNQSVLIARELGRELGVGVLEGGLRRVKQTQPQVGLTRVMRRANVRDVVLVDDVATTGATVMECARACRKAGVRRIRIAVVARG